jgi:hypothetical protein
MVCVHGPRMIVIPLRTKRGSNRFDLTARGREAFLNARRCCGPPRAGDLILRAEVDLTNGTSLRRAWLSMSCGIAGKEAIWDSSNAGDLRLSTFRSSLTPTRGAPNSIHVSLNVNPLRIVGQLLVFDAVQQDCRTSASPSSAGECRKKAANFRQ